MAALLAAAALLPAAMAAPALASCDSVHDCRYINRPEPDFAGVVLPSGTVWMEKGRDYSVPIHGGTGRGGGEVTASVTAPDGTSSEHRFTAAGDGSFHGFLKVTGSRDAEGTYSVSASYSPPGGGGHSPLGSGSFTALLEGFRADHVVEIIANGEPGCPPSGECYAGGSAAIPAGGTVEWVNSSETPHLIRAHSQGTGGTLRDVEPGDDIFETGVLPPGATLVTAFPEPVGIGYACVFHPWMDGSITVRGAPGGPAEAVREPATQEDPRPPPPPLALEGGVRWHNAGDTISVDAVVGDARSRHVMLTLYGPDGAALSAAEIPVVGGTAGYREVTQPGWEPGRYLLRAETRDGESAEKRIVIYRHGTACLPQGGGGWCNAGVVDGVIDHDTLRIGGALVTLTVANPSYRDAAREMLESSCPAGSTAVVDADSALAGDTREGGKPLDSNSYAAVYCSFDLVPVNLRMMDAGLADPDPLGCATTGFGWGRCPGITAAAEAADAVKDAAVEAASALPGAAMEAAGAVTGAVTGASDSITGAAEGVAESAGEIRTEGCAIAYLVRGTELARGAQELREIRQSMVDGGHWWLLHAAHAAYYAASPAAVEILERDPLARAAGYAALYVPLKLAGAALG